MGMAKTDDHMNKIRAKLVSKQATEEREMLDQVKKFRKGQGGNLDFLNKDGEDDLNQDGPSFKKKKASNPAHNNNKKHLEKRNYKDKKFGFGGKKKGSKMNNKE